MNGTPAARSRSRAATVLASCIRASVPSCIRAPPDAETTISGTRSARACSAARVTFSPTTAPIEPPMNPKSMTQIATGRPSMRAGAPDRGVAHARSRAGRPRSGPGRSSGRRTRADPPTRGRRRARRTSRGRGAARGASAADSRKWWPQVGQTRSDLVELLVEEHLPARRALRPEVGRVGVAAGAERRQLDRHVSRASPGAPGAPRAPPARPGPSASGRAGRGARRRSAAPAIESAAEVSAPPISSGRAELARIVRAAGAHRPAVGSPASGSRIGRGAGTGPPGPRPRPPSGDASRWPPRRAASRAAPRTGTTGGPGRGRGGGGPRPPGRRDRARGAGSPSNGPPAPNAAPARIASR